MVMSMALFDDWLLQGDGIHPSREETIDELAELILHGVNRPARRPSSTSS
jgi:hypothetical protein